MFGVPNSAALFAKLDESSTEDDEEQRGLSLRSRRRFLIGRSLAVFKHLRLLSGSPSGGVGPLGFV